LLGDLGADVIKVERPGLGDDTRAWGQALASPGDADERISVYYLSANRNKRSITVDLGLPEGAALIRKLACASDVLVENFRVGTLRSKGLGWEDISPLHPRLVYCSISGFGQTGPRAAEPGYDALVQALGGIMSLTGEPAGAPMKVGVGVADLMCGMYAAVAILAALRHRDSTGRGQHIDVALYDTQLAWLANAAVDYFATGEAPTRRGNAHPHIVPYEVFGTEDGHVMLAVGNDAQFARLARVAGAPEWASDVRFATNPARLAHRDELVALVRERLSRKPTAFWVESLAEVMVPCGPVRSLVEVFADPHTAAREMRVCMSSDAVAAGQVELLGNPLKLSDSPVRYRLPPPRLGAHTEEVLRQVLGTEDVSVSAARSAGALGA
jgi:crotonobetainyl-CoA:carnitine CoA-transferase CaiB-like acyl-CoA transferase